MLSMGIPGHNPNRTRLLPWRGPESGAHRHPAWPPQATCSWVSHCPPGPRDPVWTDGLGSEGSHPPLLHSGTRHPPGVQGGRRPRGDQHKRQSQAQAGRPLSVRLRNERTGQKTSQKASLTLSPPPQGEADVSGLWFTCGLSRAPGPCRLISSFQRPTPVLVLVPRPAMARAVLSRRAPRRGEGWSPMLTRKVNAQAQTRGNRLGDSRRLGDGEGFALPVWAARFRAGVVLLTSSGSCEGLCSARPCSHPDAVHSSHPEVHTPRRPPSPSVTGGCAGATASTAGASGLGWWPDSEPGAGAGGRSLEGELQAARPRGSS